MYEELVGYMVKALVDQPDQVDVRVDDGRSEIDIEVSVADGDAGRVIGKGGRVINALRDVVKAAADGRRISLEVLN